MNYYEIHKNKKPKKINKKSKRFRSLIVPLVALNTAMSMAQMQIIQLTPISPHKPIQIASLITNHALAISNIFKSEKQRRFKLTKRYVR